MLPVLVGVVASGLLAFAFVKWRSGREIEPSEEDIRIVQALREQN